MDDATRRILRANVLATVEQEVSALFDQMVDADVLPLEQAELLTRTRILALGADLLAAGVAARGTGKTGARVDCPCGGQATFEGYRPTGVQTLVGWIEVRRAYEHCGACRHGQVPLDQSLGLARDSHSPRVRHLASQFGALLPCSQAAATLTAAAGLQLSPSTLRVVSEAVGMRREVALGQQVTHAWRDGVPEATVPASARL